MRWYVLVSRPFSPKTLLFCKVLVDLSLALLLETHNGYPPETNFMVDMDYDLVNLSFSQKGHHGTLLHTLIG